MKIISICYVVSLLAVFFSSNGLGQNAPVIFSYGFPNKHDSDIVKLSVHNKSTSIFYYTIGLSLLINNDWEPTLSDINSLGRNEFTALKPIKAKEKVVKVISRKYMKYIYRFIKLWLDVKHSTINRYFAFVVN